MCTVLQDKWYIILWYEYFIPPVLHICYNDDFLLAASSTELLFNTTYLRRSLYFAESSYSQLYLVVISDW